MMSRGSAAYPRRHVYVSKSSTLDAPHRCSGLLPMPTTDAARTADTVSAGIPPELFDPLQEFFACAIIGFPIATTIYGITVLQTYLYFRRYPKDSAALKSLIGALWALDTLTIALISHAIYNLFVLNLGHLADDVELPWSVVLEVAITDIVIVAVQHYFAHQLYKLSRGNKVLAGSIVLLTIPTIFVGIFTLVETSFRDAAAGLRLFPASSPLVLLLGGAQAALALLCDVLVTGGLCFYFRGARVAGGRAGTNALVDRLMGYAIHRGALTTVVQGVSLATFVALPRGHVYIVFSMMIGKLYVNSLLASLNVRASLGRAALVDTMVAATATTTTLRFRDGPHTLLNADGEYSATAADGAGTILDSEHDWDDAQRSESRLTAPRMLVLRSSTGTLGSHGEVKMREHVEDAA